MSGNLDEFKTATIQLMINKTVDTKFDNLAVRLETSFSQKIDPLVVSVAELDNAIYKGNGSKSFIQRLDGLFLHVRGLWGMTTIVLTVIGVLAMLHFN